MKISALVSAAFLASASAKEVNLIDGSISTGSRLGQSLMSKARQLNENNNYYTAWMVDYSIKFDGCASVPEFEREEGLRANLLAKFKLCPSDKCSSCPNAGEYVVDLREFVESYQEAQREANEAACESQEETCEYQCENGYYEYQNNDDGQNNQNGNNQNQNQNNNGENDDEYCKYMCMSEAGMSYCDDDGDDMDAKEFAECRAMNEENQNQNNGYYNGNNNYQMYYTGAYCTSSGVYADVFTDSACTKKAPSGTYEKYNNGYSLPSGPLVEAGCQSCKYSNNNNNNNNNGENNNNNQNNNDNNNNGVLELCEELYEQAGKCEKNLKGTSYQDTSGCELIHSILPKLSSAFSTINGGVSVTKVLAWIFGISCVFMGAYIYLLHKKVIRQKVDLAALGIGGGSTEPAAGGVSA